MVKAIALVAVGIGLDVEHARQGDAVLAPAPTVGNEMVDLRRCAAAVRQSKVVAATNETSVGGSGVMVVELGVNKAGTLGGLASHLPLVEKAQCALWMDEKADLDDDEAGTRRICAGKVDVFLPAGDVEALDA